MAWITDYPNPLADEFFSRFPNPTVADVEAFIDEKLADASNLQRLNPDGSVSRRVHDFTHPHLSTPNTSQILPHPEITCLFNPSA